MYKYLVISIIFSQSLFALSFNESVCYHFLSEDQWKSIDTLESSEVCLIDMTDLKVSPTYDEAYLVFDQDLNQNFLAIQSNGHRAVLVDADIIYLLEDGNEFWGSVGRWLVEAVAYDAAKAAGRYAVEKTVDYAIREGAKNARKNTERDYREGKRNAEKRAARHRRFIRG